MQQVIDSSLQIVRNGWRERGTTGCVDIDRLIYGWDELQASLNLSEKWFFYFELVALATRVLVTTNAPSAARRSWQLIIFENVKIKKWKRFSIDFNIIAMSPIFSLSSLFSFAYISDINHYTKIEDNYSYQVIRIFYNSMRLIRMKNLETS